MLDAGTTFYSSVVVASIFSLHEEILYRVYCITKNQKIRLYGRGDLTSLFFSKVVEDKKSLRVDRQGCKNYALALVLCAFNNSKSI